MICLYLEAPFAACRTFTAGWYRPTATFLSPSAAYGLLLNIAGIESRLREEDEGHDGSAPASLTRLGLPAVKLAVGVPVVELFGPRRGQPVSEENLYPRMQSVYQQLHNYPVGSSGKERAESCRGNKYNITPVRREFLSGVRAVVALRGEPDFEERVVRGLSGQLNTGRYGVPFLGDNAFLLDRIVAVRESVPVRWFEQQDSDSPGMKDHVTRLTVQINRADLSQTRSGLFAPGEPTPSDEPSPRSWVTITSLSPPAPIEKPKARPPKMKPTGDG